jgi:hypothetical protein
MSRAKHSVAMAGAIDFSARRHLLREDGQEDLCFALWNPSYGRSRTTALINKLILPVAGERTVHGNASFEPICLERALTEASSVGAGIALLHSHPDGEGWQGMSGDDVATEQGIAGAVFGATGLPLVGLTLAGDTTWSGRFWIRAAPRVYKRHNCSSIRIVSEELKVLFNPLLAPSPVSNNEQIRTVAAWGKTSQANLTRLRVGVIGAGSVGGMVGEALARTGFEDIMLLDFDRVEEHNLDRLAYATRHDVGRLKVEAMAEHLATCATAKPFLSEPIVAAIYENEGFRAALDCDVLFSCVDRPWGRYVLNLIAYAHLIPVIDGGISVRANRLDKIAAADWKALTAMPGRQCLRCAKQYDAGLVQMEREGLLDDPTYIEGLPKGHPLKARENMFAFSMSCASLQVLQMLALTLSPLGLPNPGTQLYHFVGGTMEPPLFTGCDPDCEFPNLSGTGELAGHQALGKRPTS